MDHKHRDRQVLDKYWDACYRGGPAFRFLAKLSIFVIYVSRRTSIEELPNQYPRP